MLFGGFYLIYMARSSMGVLAETELVLDCGKV